MLHFVIAVIFIAGMFLGSMYDLQITSRLSKLTQNADGVYSISPGQACACFCPDRKMDNAISRCRFVPDNGA